MVYDRHLLHQLVLQRSRAHKPSRTELFQVVMEIYGHLEAFLNDSDDNITDNLHHTNAPVLPLPFWGVN